MVQALPSEAFFGNRSFSEGCSEGERDEKWMQFHISLVYFIII